MEELLNKLIEKGWKPRGIYTSIIGGYGLVRCEEYVGSPNRKSYRELISKESGLWQFCTENKLVNRKWQGTNWLGGEPEKCFDYKDYEYRLIESALCDEDKLEQFLLDNIKVS